MASLLYNNGSQMDNQERAAGMVNETREPPGYPLLEGIHFVPQIEMNSGHYLQYPPNFDTLPQQANFTNCFLKSILTSIDSKDEAVSVTWLETLIDVIYLLPEDVIREKIFDMALKKSRSENAKSRILIARLIGLVSSKLKAPLLKDFLLDITVSLCRDPLHSVRQAMCRELPAIAHTVGYHETSSILLPEYVRLCHAEEIEVKAIAMSIICEMLAFMDRDYRLDVMLPILKNTYDEELKEPYTLLPTLARHLGKVCHLLRNDLSVEDMNYFIEVYRKMSTIGLQKEKDDYGMPDVLLCRFTRLERESRCQCAFNLPAFVLLVGEATDYEDKLHDIVTSFLDDPFQNVCVPLAHGFHQICNIIGSKIYLLKDALLKLLKSGLEQVVVGITSNISEIFEAFHFHGMIRSDSEDNFLRNLLQAVMDADECLCNTRNWRAHSELLRQISSLVVCLPTTNVAEDVVPMLTKRMYEVKALPCRLAAARSFVVCLRYLEKTSYEIVLYKVLIDDFCDNTSFSKRMLFLQTCELALKIIDPFCFKDNLLFQALSLFNDPVPNIRLKLVELLPLIKCILSLPEDESRIQRLNFIVERLSNDESDRDVKHSVSAAVVILDQINLEEESKIGNAGEETTENVNESREAANESANDSFKDAHESDDGSRSLDDSRDRYEDAKETQEEKAEPFDEVLPCPDTIDDKSPPVPIRRPNSCRIPSYIASERRKSTTCAPELPPDAASINRLLSMDITDDEFLVDAGVRIQQPKENSSVPISTHIQLASSSSRIPVKGAALNNSDAKLDLEKQTVKTRIKTRMRPPRPVSGMLPPKPPVTASREISLSQENLRSSFTRMTVRQGANRAARKPISRRTASSCNSSPGGSRSSSPGARGRRLVCSASTSPDNSRCVSPTLDDHPPIVNTSPPSQPLTKQSSCIPRFRNSRLPLRKSKK